MRLAFCLYKYFPESGLARDMLRIAGEAIRRGHLVEVYAREWRGAIPDTVTVTVLGGDGLTNHGRAERFIRRLSDRLEHEPYDAIVGFNRMPGLDFYYCADACFAAHMRRRYPRAYELTPRYRSWRRLEESVFGPASRTRILLLSEQSGLEYRAFYATAEERLECLPPTLDPTHRRGPLDPARRTAIRAAFGADDKDMLTLMVGSGFHTKGVDRALRAHAALPAALREATRLVVVGRGKSAHYQRMAQRLGTGSQVVFAGGRNDVPELLRAADLLVHPARQENTGAVILEALAAGLPVIATANCGYARHVRDARAGVVLGTPFEQSSLNHALWNLLSAPDREALGADARRYAHDEALYRMPEAAVNLIESWRDDAPRLGFAGYIHPELAGLSRRLPRLDDWLELDGEVLRRTPDRKTFRFEYASRRYFLKAHYGVGWREVFKNLGQLKTPVLDAGNEWLAIHVLELLGVPTLTAVAYGRGPGLVRRRSFIATRELAGLISLEEYARRPRDRGETRRRRRIIDAIAATARTLHGNGVNHRDFYLCHFLLDPETKDENLHLIDLHRTQIRRRTPMRWRVKDIGGLYYSAFATVTRHERLRFVKAYAASDSLRAALADHGFWSRVDRRARALKRAEQRRGHADPAGTAGTLG